MLPTPHQTETKIDIVLGVQIPLQTGVSLVGTLYKPRPQPESLPAIIAPTIYSADDVYEIGCYLANNGYTFLAVESEGRGESQGTFEPLANHGPEGYDIVEWAAQQPWCNGNVAMWGGSYNGFYQWSTVKELPPHLVTMIPVSSVCPGIDFPLYNNLTFPYVLRWLTLVTGRTLHDKLSVDTAWWEQRIQDYLRTYQPFRAFDTVAGTPSPLFQAWMQRPTAAFWRDLLPTTEQYQQIAIPILTIVGHYDGDQIGGMHYYHQHMQHGAAARESHYLIIGPWDHSGTRKPKAEFGGIKVGNASIIDMNRLHKEWYDWTMKGGEKPSFLQKRVAYYVSGADEWRYADSLADIPTTPHRFYLTTDQHAEHPHDVFHSGTLTEEPSDTVPSATYVYDPLDNRMLDVGLAQIDPWITDQRFVTHICGDGLIYHTAAFTEPIEIIGVPRFVAWMSLDVRDTDFQVTVYEILQDGTSILLTQDFMRARYRSSLFEEALVTPGEIACYEFTRFRFIARRIAKGSRLRLVITYPEPLCYQCNYNGGGVVAEESGEDAQAAHVTLYQGGEHASFLELPSRRCEDV